MHILPQHCNKTFSQVMSLSDASVTRLMNLCTESDLQPGVCVSCFAKVVHRWEQDSMNPQRRQELREAAIGHGISIPFVATEIPWERLQYPGQIIQKWLYECSLSEERYNPSDLLYRLEMCGYEITRKVEWKELDDVAPTSTPD